MQDLLVCCLIAIAISKMTRVSGFIRKQGTLLLNNNRHAMLHVVLLALLPYTSWLSVSIVALVTLRKGWRHGGMLCLSAIIALFSASLIAGVAVIGLVNALLTFVPCYLAACALRMTVSWRAVAGVFFLQVIIVMLFLQIFMPEFIMAQFLYLQTALREMQSENAILALINEKSSLNQMILASYLLGLQAVGVVLSACISLMMARSVQSQLYYPGEFRREVMAFRGDKLGLFLLVTLFIAAHYQHVLAICLIPMLVFYFLLAGLSLSFNVLLKQRPLSSLILIVVTLFLLPFVMLPVYVIFGSLDSLFNLRLYLPSDAGKII